MSTVAAAASLAEVARKWFDATESAASKHRADELYAGRSFKEATHVSRVLAARLRVVSAGFGIVSTDDRLPNYDLTVANGHNSLAPVLTTFNADPSDWWTALTRQFGAGRTLRSTLGRTSDSLVLLALPGSYLQLITKELEALTPQQLARLRIFTSSRGRAVLPPSVRRTAMPYDERLETSVLPGTQTDFPQRALRHFVEELSGHDLEMDVAAELVSQAMHRLVKRTLPSRIRMNDDEIAELLRNNWDRFRGTSSGLLRYLRDEASIACEQRRFQGIWRQVKNQLRDGCSQ
ncbi:hypothetical protein [Paraburkholderia tropica]|uniref:hypothetical protein n=1 Tax=Paraburkholderia tropica TaxID=92647 RepID=UPI002AB77B81|nr:hypothetical protein [Paraburkholderia tropica]